MIADTPEPPYYAVIFTSVRTDGDNGYDDMSDKMLKLASEQDGFLGVESARNEIGITISYWQSLQSIKTWKTNMQHQLAQKYGREKWYEQYKVRICRTESDYEF
jgi:heme-degrading monooxygenase HmoA